MSMLPLGTGIEYWPVASEATEGRSRRPSTRAVIRAPAIVAFTAALTVNYFLVSTAIALSNHRRVLSVLAENHRTTWVVDLVTAIRSVRAEMNIPPATLTPLVLAGASAETKERAQRWNDVVKRMARLAEISFAAAAPEGAVQLLVRGEVAALPLKGVIDFSAEKARLDKELAKAEADIKRVDAKLANEKFVANAPEEIVEEEKEKREAAAARKAKILEALERLKNAV